MQRILENLELILTAAGLLVIFAVHSIWDGGTWLVAAGTATAVGVIHGVIFWLVRRRQRKVRRIALEEAQHMLRDLVNNQLCVIQFTADMQTGTPESVETARARITESVRTISSTLEGISEESLSRWSQKYAMPPKTAALS